jgi:hypothetical protein
MSRAPATTRFAPTAAAATACFDGAGGATLAAPPSGVVAGTRIATPDGSVAAEDLHPGDLVQTAAGAPARVAAVARRMLAADALRRDTDGRPVRLAADAIANGVPRQDLLLAPEQLLLIDGIPLRAAALVNGVSITRVASGGSVAYVRIRLDQPGAFLADGAACDGSGQRAAPAACLAEVLRMLAARIGLAGGKLLGNVATADHAGAAGWTLDEAHPEAPVAVEFLVRGRVVAHALADLRRPDLAVAGVGDGRCGFAVQPRRKLPPGPDHLLQVRRTGDGADVPGSPLLLPHAAGTSADFDVALAHATAAATPATRDDLAAFLAGQVDRLLRARADRPPVLPAAP